MQLIRLGHFFQSRLGQALRVGPGEVALREEVLRAEAGCGGGGRPTPVHTGIADPERAEFGILRKTGKEQNKKKAFIFLV